MRTIRAYITALIFTTVGLTGLLTGCSSQTGPSDAAKPAAAPGLTAITSVTASQAVDQVVVIVSADGPITFSSLKQPDPLAVVLYFPETTVDQARVDLPADIDLVPRITTREGNGQRTARIEILLSADAAYTAAQEGNTVQVRFNRASAAPSAAPAAEPASRISAASPPATTPAKSPATTAAAAPAGGQMPSSPPIAPSGKAVWVNKVDFVGEENGKSTLVVGTTAPVDFRINKTAPQRIELRLLDTGIPSYHQRPLITTRFNSAVDRVTPTQPVKGKNESLIVIDLRETVPYVAEQTGNQLLIHFEPSAIPPKPLEQADLPAWKRALNDTQSDTVTAAEVSGERMAPLAAAPAPTLAEGGAAPATAAARADLAALDEAAAREEAELQSMIGPRRKNFTGEKIALDFYETDIKNVFRILREVSGKNFAIDKDVTGKVTMTLDKPVPWDQVLDLVLRMNQLGMVQEGDIVRIATLETLKKEDDLRKAKLEAYRKAREEVKALEPLVTKYIPVSYSSAASEVKPHIEKILTKERGSVSVDEKNNQVIITDTAAVIRQAEEIVRRIDKVTSQVVIEARVVEVSDNFSRELGIDWNMSYGAGLLGDWATTTDMAMNFPSQASSNIGIGFSRLTGVPFVLNARLNALETTGEGKILSAPKILTLDNKKAKIKQGVEYPYLERDSSGGSSVKFKNIDLLLEVTPHVTPDNRVSLIIFITKNDVAGITAGVPSVSTNEAQTELLVNDGDTVVIGGIIKSSESRGSDGFPALSKIPVLGWLFKNTTTKKQSNELLIFMTPRIVQLEQAVSR
ncbi:MAG: type IV pilus secretin PilQ [Desulfatitalea sp.]